MSAEGTALTFKYDHNGLRTQKTVQTDWLPETTNYYLHGKLLTHMTVDYTDFDEVAHTDKLHFFYDAQSRPAQVSFNGVIYTYIHNLQGDIVGILDNSGALVVEYKYDAWGKLLSVTGNLKDTLGKRNPFRYRGYVYDEETGLYYLRSRYYNPTVGRFVNADKYVGEMAVFAVCNVYAYCANVPANRVDSDGTRSVNVYSEMPIVHDVPIDAEANKACVTRHAVAQLLTNAAIAKKQVEYISKTYSNAFECIAELYLWFAKQETHSGAWNYKRSGNEPVWLTEHCTKTVVIADIEMDMEDYGNFHYGFVGYTIGISRNILIAGSIFAHYTSHGNFDDDPHDWEMIDAGIEFARQCQENGMLSY